MASLGKRKYRSSPPDSERQREVLGVRGEALRRYGARGDLRTPYIVPACLDVELRFMPKLMPPPKLMPKSFDDRSPMMLSTDTAAG